MNEILKLALEYLHAGEISEQAYITPQLLKEAATALVYPYLANQVHDVYWCERS